MARPRVLSNPVARAVVLALSVMAAATSTACQPAKPATVSMRMAGGVPRASVTIDDMYVGTIAEVSRRGVALPPGTHRISVEHAGYFPWDKLIKVQEGDPPVHLNAVLKKIPD